MARQGSGRTVFGLNAAVSVTLVVLVAVIALVVKPPAPPGIAAFAPQASRPITKAPPQQSSVSGEGGGACAAGQVCTSPSPTAGPVPTTGVVPPEPPAVGVPSALQCYTWPDGSVTQTFDPQSPPCIASWPDQAKGNGGATTRGVTATAIRLAVPTSPTGTVKQLSPLVDFVNSHFQLYGRRIQLVPFASKQSAQYSTSLQNVDPSAQKADAATALSLNAFAATDFVDAAPSGFALPSYLSTLAEHRMVTVSGGQAPPLISDEELRRDAPYAWTYSPTSADLMANTATMTCHGLVGRRARHAPAYATATRSFAIALPAHSVTGGALPGERAMVDRLSGCVGSEVPVVYFDPSTSSGAAEQASLLELKNKGVTTLLYYPAWGSPTTAGALPPNAAASVKYEPEWVFLSHQSWITANAAASQPDVADHGFGIAAWNKQGPLPGLPWYQAFVAGGGSPERAGRLFAGASLYEELLLLASGIQMAGPHLTPETFAAALAGTTFPNPGAGAAPSYQARVGFTEGSPTMVKDYAGIWFDPPVTAAQMTADGQTQATVTHEAFCYVRLGARWSGDAWPRTDDFLSGRCR